MKKKETPSTDPGRDPRDDAPPEEAPETPTDEPKPVPVQDPPSTEPAAPYTVDRACIGSGRSSINVLWEAQRGVDLRR